MQDICVSGTFLQYLNQFPEEDRVVRRSDGSIHKSMVSDPTRKRTIETVDAQVVNPNKFRVIECDDEDRDNSTAAAATEDTALAVKLSTEWRGSPKTVDILELD
jgi:hypothetical protein